jgi:hypothetical protein
MAVLKPQPLPASLLLLPTEPSELESFVCGRLQRECALDDSCARRIRCGRAYPERRLLDRESLIAVVSACVLRGVDLMQWLGFPSDPLSVVLMRSHCRGKGQVCHYSAK